MRMVGRLRVVVALIVASLGLGCQIEHREPVRVELAPVTLSDATLEALARTRTQATLEEQPTAQTARRRAQKTEYRQTQAGFSPEELQLIARNCLFGLPTTDSTWNHGTTHFVVRDGYVLQHSSLDKIPLWVCEGVSVEQLQGSAQRKDKFKADPKLPEGERAELEDYRGSGYDRGHQAPAGDQNHEQRLKDETFYLSNMAPQVGSFNQQIWRELETDARDWAEERGGAFVITGPIFWDPQEDDPATADGIIEYYVVGPGQVAVPTHFFKIVIAKNDQGEWEAIAFLLENRGYPKPWDFSTYIESVDWIEERTGLNFMPDLDPVEEQRLERQRASMW